VEVFSTQTKKAQGVTRCVQKEISHRFLIPGSVGLENGQAFVAEVVQLMAMGLGITWKLHTAYHPRVKEKWNVGIEPKNYT
jgi:hypothetical protein